MAAMNTTPPFRFLQTSDDFAGLNAILATASFAVGSAQVAEGLLLHLGLHNIVCRNLSITNVSLRSVQTLPSAVNIYLDITGLDVTCSLDFTYRTLLFFGDQDRPATVHMGTKDTARLTLTVASSTRNGASSSLATTPPTTAHVRSCAVDLEIAELDIDDGGILWGLAPVERVLSRVVARQASSKICELLSTQDDDDATSVWLQAMQAHVLDPYPREYQFTSVASMEEQVVLQNAVATEEEEEDWLRWPTHTTTTTSTAPAPPLTQYWGQWFQQALTWGTEWLTATEEEPTTTTSSSTATPELRINRLLRDYVLDKNDGGALNITHNDLTWTADENRITQISITFHRLQLLGLDTVERLDPFQPRARHTMESSVEWKQLEFVVHATVRMGPSTRRDAIVVSTSRTTPGTTEHVTLRWTVGRLRAALIVTALVEGAAAATLPLGHVLRQPLACPLSLVHALQLSRLEFNLQESLRVEPVLDGFIDRGLDRLFTSAVAAAMDIYQPLLLQSLPALFDTTIREALQTALDTWRTRAMEEDCDRAAVASTSASPLFLGRAEGTPLDWRDLLLEPEAAMLVGGSGWAPYGTMVSYGRNDMLQKRWLDVDVTTGRPKINIAIAAMTGGTLSYPEIRPVVNVSVADTTAVPAKLLRSVSMGLEGLHWKNMDSVVAPLTLLDVQHMDDTTLHNRIQLGTINGTQSLEFSTQVHVRAHADDSQSPLRVDNTFALTVRLQPSVAVDTRVLLDENTVMSFPMQDLLHADCWAAALLRAPDITLLEVGMSGLDVQLQCVSCTSVGANELLPSLLEELHGLGYFEVIGTNLAAAVNDMILSYWNDQLDLPHAIAVARLLCPHSPLYDDGAVVTHEWPGMPPLSDTAAHTLGHVAAMALQLWLLTMAHGHLNDPNPVDTIERVDPEILDSSHLIDWNNLCGTVGDWADSALQGLRDVTSKTVIDEMTGERVLAINSLMKDRDGEWTLPLHSDALFSIGGSQLFASNLRLKGLDTFRKVEPWNVVASQSIETIMSLGELAVEVDVGFDLPYGGNMTIEMGLHDVELEIAIVLNVLWDELGDVKIGSLLQARGILPCLAAHVLEAALTKFTLNAADVSSLTTNSRRSRDDTDLRLAAQTFFQNHETEFLQSLPLMTNTTLRHALNALLLGYRDDQDHVCGVPARLGTGDVVDFRDLLLSKAGATEYGGSGSAPYGDTIPLMFQILQSKLSDEGFGSESILNQLLVRPVTTSQSNVNGSIFVQDVYNTEGTTDISNWNFAYKLVVSELSMKNLDSIHSPFSILQPVKGLPTTLRSSLMIGKEESPLELSVSIHLNIEDDQGNRVDNEINVALELNHVSLVLSVMVALSESALFSLPVKEVKDANCWLATIDIASLRSSLLPLLNYTLSAEHAVLNIACVSCSTPKFDALAQQIYSPGDTPEEIQSFLDQSKNSVDQFLGSEFFQKLFSLIVSDAKALCPNNDEYDPAAPTTTLWDSPEILFRSTARDSKMRVLTIVNTIVGTTVIAAFFAARLFIQRKGHALRSRGSLADLTSLLDWQESHQMSKHTFVDAATQSMFSSDTISVQTRYFVPGVIILNLALFICGHTAILSYLNVEADVGGERISIRRFLEFVFFQDAQKTYRAGGNEMALMLILFSGVWPYVKLLAAFALWFLPPSIIPTSRRGYLLLWMDILSKLSIIDITMTLFAVAVFLVYIGGPGDSFYDSRGNFYSLTIVVVPKAGFYCLLVAQRMNRLGSRFLLECHQKIVACAMEEYESQTGTNDWSAEIEVRPMTTRSSNLSSPLDGNHTATSTAALVSSSQPEHSSSALATSFIGNVWKRVNDWWQKRFVKLRSSVASCACWNKQMAGTCSLVLGCICIFTLLIIGSVYAPAISINVEEILSMGLESDRTLDITVQDINVFTVFFAILLQCRFVLENATDFVGLGILLGLVMMSSFLFPVVQGIKKVLAWAKTNHHWTFLIRPTDGSFGSAQPAASRSFLYHPRAWENVEVFIIAFSIAMWQLGAVTAYVIHSYCQGLLTFYGSLASVGIVNSQPGANCFRTQASDPLTLVVIIGSFLSLFISFLYQVIMQYRKNVDRMRLDIGNRSDSPRFYETELGLPTTTPEETPTERCRWMPSTPKGVRDIFRRSIVTTNDELQITMDTASVTDVIDNPGEPSVCDSSVECPPTTSSPVATEIGSSWGIQLNFHAAQRWIKRRATVDEG